ncbi:MAG TPA: hypothetical protein VHH11_16325 [Gammaproteobacteria bacterium]|nr:hypothetical protein [Gammaproteobacteria bacterium]
MTAGPTLDHDAAFELLPWLVNGSLAVAERDRVDGHVRSCIVCRREVRELERLRAAVRAQPTFRVSAEGGFDRLERELDREAARARAANGAASAPFLRFAAVAAIGIVVLGALLWLEPKVPDQARYATLATQPVGPHAQIDLIFDQRTAAADIQSLLTDVDGEIVAGPTELGRYSIRIQDGKATDADIAALLDRLSHDPRVRFAGRAFTGPTQ